MKFKKSNDEIYKRGEVGSYLLVEDGLSLTTITGLFAIVTTLTLSSYAIFTLLVLGNLVKCMLLAFLALAVGFLRLWNVHLQIQQQKRV